MGLAQTLRDWFGSPADVMADRRVHDAIDVRQGVGAVVVPPYMLGKPQWTTGTPQRYVSEGWGKAPVVFACVLAIADAVSTATIAVKRDTGNGEVEPAEDTELQLLLNRPNAGMDQAEFLQVVNVIAELSGFCVVEKERNRMGEVIGLWPLRSDWLRPIPRRDSLPAWEYNIPGYLENPPILEPEDVFVYTAAPDPNLGYVGTSPLAVAFRELGIENLMTDFLKAFFDRGALPVYGVIPKQKVTSQEEADAFRSRMMGRYGGALKSAEPMLLTGIEDVKRLGFDFDELAYPELRALSETQICTAFRVPPILIGVQAGLDASTYSNYGQARRNFFEDVISSKWRRLDGALTRGLVPDFDIDGSLSVEFDTDDVPALQDDEDAKWVRATAALNAGGISTHTYQRIIGLDPHGPDVIYQPFSAVPVAISQNGQRSKATIALLGEQAPQVMHSPNGSRTFLHGAERVHVLQDGLHVYEVRDGRTYLLLDHLTENDQTRYTRAAEHNRNMMGQLAAMLEPRMAEFFQEQGQRVGEMVFGERGTVAGATKVIIATRALEDWQWDNELNHLRTMIEQWFGDAGTLVFSEIAKQLDTAIEWEAGNLYIQDLLEELGKRIVGIHETTRRDVESIIVDGLAEGVSIPDLAERLQGLFEETYKNRATTVARTESQFAANTAAGAAYDAAGIQRAVIFDNPAHDTDPGTDGLTCAGRNGLVVPVQQIVRHANAEHPNGTMAVGPIVEGA